MMITNKLKLDLQKPGTTPTVSAVQNDSYSRKLELSLFADGRPFLFPDNGTVVIRYRKSDGKGGEYDTLPDGTAAWWAERNVLTVALAPQVLTTPGSVSLTVTLLSEGTQLSVFPIRLAVEPVSTAKIAKSEDYFYITGLLPAPVSGTPGQCLRISAVNEAGRITAVEAVDCWTETERDALVQEVLAALGTPVFGSVDADNNIILTGTLPDGTYILKYEDAEGNLTEIGTLNHSSADYINLAEPAGEEWNANHRIKSNGTLVEASGCHVTNFIPCESGDLIRIKGHNIGFSDTANTRAQAFFYGEDKTTAIARCNPIDGVTGGAIDGFTKDDTNALWTHTIGASAYTILSGSISDIRYARFCGLLYDGYTAEDVIITVNQEIV